LFESLPLLLRELFPLFALFAASSLQSCAWLEAAVSLEVEPALPGVAADPYGCVGLALSLCRAGLSHGFLVLSPPVGDSELSGPMASNCN